MIRIIGQNNEVLKEYPNITGYDEFLPSGKVNLQEGQFLVAVWFDGSPNFYIADGAPGIREVEQKYKDDWDVPPHSSYKDHVSGIQVFREIQYATISFDPPSMVKKGDKK